MAYNIIWIPDGSRIEVDGINVKHISQDNQILYDSTQRILYGQEQIDIIKKKWKSDIDESVKKES